MALGSKVVTSLNIGTLFMFKQSDCNVLKEFLYTKGINDIFLTINDKIVNKIPRGKVSLHSS